MGMLPPLVRRSAAERLTGSISHRNNYTLENKQNNQK